MKKVSVIICAYNEEKTIKDVVKSVSGAEIADEIIVVNDGSTDSTMEMIEALKKEFEITAIHLSKNMGKGYAMAIGVENTNFDLMVFVDADQRIIPTGYIKHLASPLLSNECDMVLGYTTVNVLNQEVNPFKILTGERSLYKKDIAPILEKMKETRFGVETLLYLYYSSLEKSLKFIYLAGMEHNDKYKKMNFIKATTSYFNEGWEIAYITMNNYDLLLKIINRKVKKLYGYPCFDKITKQYQQLLAILRY
ncbi:MAG: glycosyltransferase family 2 protein [Bacteroidales bacterium]